MNTHREKIGNRQTHNRQRDAKLIHTDSNLNLRNFCICPAPAFFLCPEPLWRVCVHAYVCVVNDWVPWLLAVFLRAMTHGRCCTRLLPWHRAYRADTAANSHEVCVCVCCDGERRKKKNIFLSQLKSSSLITVLFKEHNHLHAAGKTEIEMKPAAEINESLRTEAIRKYPLWITLNFVPNASQSPASFMSNLVVSLESW